MPTPRPATPADVGRLREIEVSAGEVFSSIGMDAIAHDEPPTAARYESAVARRQITVIDDEYDYDDEAATTPPPHPTRTVRPEPIAYLWAFELDGALHIEQVSVAATHARRGLGRRLIDHAADAARTRGLTALTLTTFTHVPWNAPYYARLGFRAVPEPRWTPGLRRVRDAEAADGLDAWPRVVMRRTL